MPLQALHTLLMARTAERDLAAAQAAQAEQLSQRAKAQAEQLLTYRQEYQSRYSPQATGATTPMALHAYRSFMARLDDAVTQQQRQVEISHTQARHAAAVLMGAEQQVASVRKLIERRQAQAAKVAQARDQRQTDEQAARSAQQAPMNPADGFDASTLHGAL